MRFSNVSDSDVRKRQLLSVVLWREVLRTGCCEIQQRSGSGHGKVFLGITQKDSAEEKITRVWALQNYRFGSL